MSTFSAALAPIWRRHVWRRAGAAQAPQKFVDIYYVNSALRLLAPTRRRAGAKLNVDIFEGWPARCTGTCSYSLARHAPTQPTQPRGTDFLVKPNTCLACIFTLPLRTPPSCSLTTTKCSLVPVGPGRVSPSPRPMMSLRSCFPHRLL